MASFKEWLGFCETLPERGSSRSKPAVWRAGVYEVAPRRGRAADGDEIIGKGGELFYYYYYYCCSFCC